MRLIDRIRSWFRPAMRTPAATTNDNYSSTLDDVAEYINRDVKSGFYDEDTILLNVFAAFGEEFDYDELRKDAQLLLREALVEQADAQRMWPEQTDCDRLDAAFAALEVDGIVARQNFTCCGTCGSYEIWDEIKSMQEAGEPARGYTFYHMQDTESAVEGHGIYLGYGACDEGEEAALAIGHEIVARMNAHGLSTAWTGELSQRIAVKLDWKRRR